MVPATKGLKGLVAILNPASQRLSIFALPHCRIEALSVLSVRTPCCLTLVSEVGNGACGKAVTEAVGAAVAGRHGHIGAPEIAFLARSDIAIDQVPRPVEVSRSLGGGEGLPFAVLKLPRVFLEIEGAAVDGDFSEFFDLVAVVKVLGVAGPKPRRRLWKRPW